MSHLVHRITPYVAPSAPPGEGKTIGSGGDYPDVQAWWNALPATLTQPEVGILLDGDHLIPNPIDFYGVQLTGKVTSAVNTVTLRAETPHGGVWTAGPRARLITDDARRYSTVLSVWNDYVHIEDIVFLHSEALNSGNGDKRVVGTNPEQVGVFWDRCLIGFTNPITANGSKAIWGAWSAGSEGSHEYRSCVTSGGNNGVTGSNAYRGAAKIIQCTMYNEGSGGMAFSRCSPKGSIGFGFATHTNQTISPADNASDLAAGAFQNKIPSTELENAALLGDFRLAATTTLQDVIATNHGASFDFLNNARPQGSGYDCGAHERG